MQTTITNIFNSSNWQLILNETLNVVQVTDSSYTPIPPRAIQSNFARVAIAIGNPNAKPTWRLGAYCNHNLIFNPSANFSIPGSISDRVYINRYSILLNQWTMLELGKYPHAEITDNFIPNYELKFSFPRWHKEINLKIYGYTGIETDIINQKLDTIINGI
jgi:hypothetical protein